MAGLEGNARGHLRSRTENSCCVHDNEHRMKFCGPKTGFIHDHDHITFLS